MIFLGSHDLQTQATSANSEDHQELDFESDALLVF
jgi:hypothetical protein